MSTENLEQEVEALDGETIEALDRLADLVLIRRKRKENGETLKTGVGGGGGKL